jgi:hypothetical protein
MFNASGDEHALQFTLAADPAVLTNGEITAGPDAAGAAIVLDRSMEPAGKLGVTVTLPGSAVFTAGLKALLSARFDVSPAAAPGSVTTLAFGDEPVQGAARSASGALLPVVFDPGNIPLEAVQAAISSAPAAPGSTALTVRGLRGKTYQLLGSTDLVTWTVIESALIGPSGTVVFTAPPAGGRIFYMAAPAP